MKRDVNKHNERIYTNRNGNVYTNTYKYTVYEYRQTNDINLQQKNLFAK